MKEKVPSKIVETPLDVHVEVNELERIIKLTEPETGAQISFTSPNRELNDDEAERVTFLVVNYPDIIEEVLEEIVNRQEERHGNERP